MAAKDGGEDKSDALGAAVNAVTGVPIPLKRTGAAIDRLISVPFNVWADQLDAKMRGNTENHVQAVQKKRTKKGKKTSAEDVSVKAAKSIVEWTEASAEVDEKDEQLSAVWRGLLDAILDDRDDPEELLRIVRRTAPSDLRLFLTRGRSPVGLLLSNNAAVDRLKANGLVESFMPKTIFFLLLVFSGTAVLYATLIQSKSLDRMDQFPVYSVALSMSALLPLAFFWVSSRPSKQGKKLILLYREYLSIKD
ncbi:hypothetical protein [Bradyrhizobium sp. cf659]|uniref:hypothetical protein n=1 Tax=Bradyrhizobium sp. cf659 TaxID=1761771 RepID=UPI0008DF8691|nr:hypothetical protein [Bradyrhizobium sp. cf659]SFJ53931.1 hypothetical protein SAMN04487925_108278 [Bradyrhizobium sp. cf659]